MTGVRPMSESAGWAERLVRHDKTILIAAICAIFVLTAIYTVSGVGMKMSALEMTRMAGPVGEPMAMASATNWTLGYAFLVFLMWWIMMIAMMTPSAAPVLLLFTTLKRHGSQRARATGLSMMFLAGFLLVWMGFSAAATSIQWVAESMKLSNGAMMALGTKPAAGVVLLAAGLYQFSSLKAVCLRHCRSPVHFLTANNRKGYSGALMMGLHHGAYCCGCCWVLMVLLFVGGIMNLYWIVGIAVYVLAEKLMPRPRLFAGITGAVLIAWGLWCIYTSL